MNKELIRGLITFDDTDTSSGFVSVSSGNTFRWDDVYEFDEWLQKEFQKYDIDYDGSYHIEQNIFGFSFCDDDIEGQGATDYYDYDDEDDISDNFQVRIDAFHGFCDTGDFTYMDPLGDFADNFNNFTNEREYNAYQNKIIKVARKIQKNIKSVNESVQNIITFDEDDVSTGFNSVTGPIRKQGLFWDADYGSGYMNSQSFGTLWLSCFPQRIKINRDNMNFTISVRHPVTVNVRVDETYHTFRLEFFADIRFSGDLVDGVYPVVWYDDVVKAVNEWIPDRDNIHSWPPSADVDPSDWDNKVIPAFREDKKRILNVIRNKMKARCQKKI